MSVELGCDSFRWLLHPVTPESFIAQSWERSFLHVKRELSVYYESFFRLQDLENSLQVCHFRSPDLRVLRNQVEMPDTAYLTDGKIDLIRLSKAFHEGYTLVVNGLHRCCPSIAEFSRKLACCLSHEVVPNIYFSPASSQGLHPHYDTHDVFVLQLDGQKTWRLYHRPISHPLLGSFQPVFERDSLGTPQAILTLMAGDLLYIPRGLVHEAETDDSHSLHMTVGIYPSQYSDFLANAFRLAANYLPELRESLPIGFQHSGADEIRVREKAVELLNVVLQRFDAKAVMDFMKAESLSRASPASGQVPMFHRLNSVNMKTRLQKHEATLCRVTVTDAARIQFPGNTIRGAAECAGAFEFVAEHEEPFTPSDLPAPLSTGQKLELCRRMIRGGLLRILD
jgi:ribosomal protein L16 Arg81 hydroxylase